jgi:hypothetical protein
MKSLSVLNTKKLNARKAPRVTPWGLAALLLVGSLLAACASAKPPAALAVENYLQALVDKDEARLVSLTCPDFEDEALLQFDSFSLVKTKLEGLDCQAQVQEDTAQVTCQGQILATYGTEDQQFDLSEKTFQVVNQGGDWLVCGE